MKKIMYFDKWTRGIKHFAFFDQSLKIKGVETFLFHLSSIVDNEKHNIVLEGIETRDINSYKTNFIHDVLEIEKPDLVILLNVEQILDRAIILSCHKLKIKVLFIAHGSFNANLLNAKNSEVANYIYSTNKYRKSIIYLKRYLLNYIYSLYKNSIWNLLNPHYYFILIETFLFPQKSFTFSKYHKSLNADRFLVYSENDRNIFTNIRKFPSDNIHVVGIPDLDHTDDDINKITLLIKYKIPSTRKILLYLEEGLVSDKYWTTNDWYNFIDEINFISRKNKMTLVIKLHPRTSFKDHEKYFRDRKDIIVLENVKIVSIVSVADVVISHYSTTLNAAFMFGKPVVIPSWGKSKLLYKLYPSEIVSYCETKNDFEKWLEDETVIKKNREKYCKDNITFFDGKTKERILSHINSMLN